MLMYSEPAPPQLTASLVQHWIRFCGATDFPSVIQFTAKEKVSRTIYGLGCICPIRLKKVPDRVETLRRVASDVIRSRRAVAISGRRMTTASSARVQGVSSGVTGGMPASLLHTALRRVATPTMFTTRMKL